MNLVVLVGRLTNDPELRTTSGGTSYCRFSVAVDRSYVKAGEERKADFINCVAWGKQAEFISRYFAKGRRIGLHGSIETGSYTNRDGQKVYTTDVRVDNAEFVDSKPDGQSSSSYTGSSYGANRQTAPQTQPQPEPAPSYSSGSASDFAAAPLDDDLPF